MQDSTLCAAGKKKLEGTHRPQCHVPRILPPTKPSSIIMFKVPRRTTGTCAPLHTHAPGCVGEKSKPTSATRAPQGVACRGHALHGVQHVLLAAQTTTVVHARGFAYVWRRDAATQRHLTVYCEPFARAPFARRTASLPRCRGRYRGLPGRSQGPQGHQQGLL